ncbi:deoxyuridine 5'-triphosphate nucleotidohydrolase [Ramicandelaber brevisporus]|nr:deoxyuridine 5'-triphosphate nucleotidohydrolase [Ramicandelaber brevisporus]
MTQAQAIEADTTNSTHVLKKHKVESAAAAPASSFRVFFLNQNATVPKRSSSGAAGYDLCASEDTVIAPRSGGVVSTGLVIQVPSGTYGRVAPRSGLAVKNSIDTMAGVIDEDYRGEVKVALFNHGDKEFEIKAGNRIAQLVLERIVTPEIEVVSSLESLDSSERGQGGFGSTGI